MAKKQTLGQIFKNFVENTSVRGAPRIITSCSVAWKVIWLLVVLIFLFLTAWSMAQIFMEYFEYGKVSNTYERFVERVEVPSLTVCNLNPLPNDGASPPSGVLSWSEYQQMVNDKGLDLNQYSNLKGYFQTLGRENASKVGNSFEEFVLGCYVVFENDGKDSVRVPCTEAAKIKKVISVDYFNCYTVEYSDEKQPGSHPVGFTLAFYVGAIGKTIDTDFSLEDDTSGSGIRLVLHPHGVVPDIAREGVNIPPGYTTSVEAKVKETKLLGAPYGHCGASESHMFDLNGERINYTPALCKQACAQKIVTDQCECLMPEVMAVKSSDEAKQPYCGALLDDQALMKARADCLASAKNDISQKCMGSCPISCHEASYPTTTSTARWPPMSQHLSFYNSIIKGKSYASNFQIYDSIEDELQSGNEAEAKDLLMKTNHIYENFLKVNIHVDGNRMEVTEEIVKHTLGSLGPKLGGMMSIYCGVTLVLFVEILQLICCVISYVICGAKASVTSDCKKSTSTTGITSPVRDMNGIDGPAVEEPVDAKM